METEKSKKVPIVDVNLLHFPGAKFNQNYINAQIIPTVRVFVSHG